MPAGGRGRLPCVSKPADPAAAETLARSRVTYPAPAGWDQDFAALHGELSLLVAGGPAAGAMRARQHPELPGVPLGAATESTVPHLPEGVKPLELLLLAALQPAMAQMLGLYFVDQAVAPGVP